MKSLYCLSFFHQDFTSSGIVTTSSLPDTQPIRASSTRTPYRSTRSLLTPPIRHQPYPSSSTRSLAPISCCASTISILYPSPSHLHERKALRSPSPKPKKRNKNGSHLRRRPKQLPQLQRQHRHLLPLALRQARSRAVRAGAEHAGRYKQK